MKKYLVATLAVALVLGVGLSSPAQDTSAGAKPVVTVSFAGYDRMVANLQKAGELAGKPQLAQALEGGIALMTQGKGLAGLDKSRPWGVLIHAAAGDKYPIQVFVPVTDLKALMSLVPNPKTGEPFEPGADGVYEVAGAAPGKTAYIVQKDKWAILADSREGLTSAPADPAALLGELPKKYLLAVQLAPKNLPPATLNKYLQQFKALMDLGMMQQGGDDDAAAVQAAMAKQSFDRIAGMVKDLDNVLLGWGFDTSAGSTYLDIEVTALPGTKLAAELAKAKDAKTDFGGFVLPGAAVTALSAGEMSEEDAVQTKKMLAKYRATATKDIGENEDLNDNQKKLAKELIADVFDIFDKTLDRKKSDAGLALMLEGKSWTFVAGAAVAEGGKLDKVLKRLVEEAGKEEPEMAKMVKLDVDKHEGVAFHMATIPVADPEAAAAFGTKIEVVVGIADNSLYLGAGKNVIKTLKAAIDASKAAPGKAIAPFEMVVSGAPIARFIAQVVPDEDAKAVAGAIAGQLAGGKDRVTIKATAIPNGTSVRLNIEEGILKAVLTNIPMGGNGKPGKRPPMKKSEPEDGDSPF